MKTAPVLAELERRGDRLKSLLVHTGQHYDDSMSRVFFDQLGIPNPDHTLGVGPGSHAQQTARVMERLEPLLAEIRPDLVLVPGDVNSTLGAALAAAKLNLPVAHLEAGLRSFDRSMPEEINRLIADAVAQLHFTHSPEARENLLREGVAASSIHAVGNTMIDTLYALRGRSEVRDAPERQGLPRRGYLVVTLHRPHLVDGPMLGDAMRLLAELSAALPVVFPVHPRTQAALDGLPLSVDRSRLRMLPPLGYLEFLGLMAGAAGVLTDSGGVQEETTVLGVPCFTLRETTERPVTVELGTNTVLGLAPERIAEIPRLLEQAASRSVRIPPGWDGRAAERVADVIEQYFAEVSA